MSNFIGIGNNSNLNEMEHASQKGNCAVSTSMEFWYAIHTRRHYENVVTEMLGAKGFDAYLPMLEERRRWADRTKVLKVPLFANYTFNGRFKSIIKNPSHKLGFILFNLNNIIK